MCNFWPMAKRIGGDLILPQAHYLREWRKFRGMSGEHLAGLCGTTKASVSRIENFGQALTDPSAALFGHHLRVHPTILRSRPPNESDLDPTSLPLHARIKRKTRG